MNLASKLQLKKTVNQNVDLSTRLHSSLWVISTKIARVSFNLSFVELRFTNGVPEVIPYLSCSLFRCWEVNNFCHLEQIQFDKSRKFSWDN